MKKVNYEKSIKKLEDVIENLETKELSLDDSLKLFKEGIDLYRLCNAKLNEAEEQIQMIIEENGVIKRIPFSDEED